MTSSAPTTRPVAPQHAFDADALAAWLRERLDGFDGPLQVEQFSGGQSNPTFRLRTPAGQELIAPTELLQTRDVSYNETQALAKEAEEALLMRNMQSDMVQQLLRRLAAVRLAGS